MLFPAVVRELLWFLRGSTNINDELTQHTPIWDAWADPDGELGPIYGAQWRSWGGRGIDQIQQAIDTIKRDPTSRRIIVSAWNVEDLPKMKLPPCHALFQFYANAGFLDCQLYQRSADLALGIPFNIASYALLMSMIAQDCALRPRHFIHTFGDAHIYLNHVEGVKIQLEREPLPPPTLVLANKPTLELRTTTSGSRATSTTRSSSFRSPFEPANLVAHAVVLELGVAVPRVALELAVEIRNQHVAIEVAVDARQVDPAQLGVDERDTEKSGAADHERRGDIACACCGERDVERRCDDHALGHDEVGAARHHDVETLGQGRSGDLRRFPGLAPHDHRRRHGGRHALEVCEITAKPRPRQLVGSTDAPVEIRGDDTVEHARTLPHRASTPSIDETRRTSDNARGCASRWPSAVYWVATHITTISARSPMRTRRAPRRSRQDGTYEECDGGALHPIVCESACSATLGCVSCDPATATACDGSAVVTCNADGTFGSAMATCGQGEQCVAGSCSATCTADGVDLVYVVDETNDFMSFDPRLLPNDPFTLIGTLACPTTKPSILANQSMVMPMSMSVDRDGTAWVLYTSGELFEVSLQTAQCTAANNTVAASGMSLFGMGFVTDVAMGTTEKLYMAGGNTNPASVAAQASPTTTRTAATSRRWSSAPSARPATTRPSSPAPTKRSSTDSFRTRRRSRTSRRSTRRRARRSARRTTSVRPGSARITDWAFAQWGGVFYVFVTTQANGTRNSTVRTIDRATGTYSVVLQNLQYFVDGAGVSTCAPSTLE